MISAIFSGHFEGVPQPDPGRKRSPWLFTTYPSHGMMAPGWGIENLFQKVGRRKVGVRLEVIVTIVRRLVNNLFKGRKHPTCIRGYNPFPKYYGTSQYRNCCYGLLDWGDCMLAFFIISMNVQVGGVTFFLEEKL